MKKNRKLIVMVLLLGGLTVACAGGDNKAETYTEESTGAMDDFESYHNCLLYTSDAADE